MVDDYPIRNSLMMLADEFQRASDRYPDIFHDEVDNWWAGQMEPFMYAEEWRAFIAAQTSCSNEWQEWHGPHIYSRVRSYSNEQIFIRDYAIHCGRFYGDELENHKAALGKFKQLADNLYLVLRHIKTPLHYAGWPGTLEMLYLMAKLYPTPLVRVEEGIWDWEPNPADCPEDQEADREGCKFLCDPRGFVIHPLKSSIKNNLFTVTHAAIRHILDPRSMLLVGESHSERLTQFLPYLLPPSGEEPVKTTVAVAKHVSAALGQVAPIKRTEPRPCWDEVKRELWFGKVLLKRFGKVAVGPQIVILTAFHKEGWPPKVTPHLDSENEARARHCAIYDLNRGLRNKTLMYFDGDGDRNVRWNLGPKPPTTRKKRK